MEDDLNFVGQMKDDLKDLGHGRQPQRFRQMEDDINFFRQMEDDLNFS